MTHLDVLNMRIRDHLSKDWLTPSQLGVWKALHQFDGPPHRVVCVFGPEGCGKTFLGWLLERESYATYGIWSELPRPVLPRLILDNAPSDRSSTREVRPWVEQFHIQQIILLTRARVDEPFMPAFELRVTPEDIEHFRANLYRHLRVIASEQPVSDYKTALNLLEE